MPEHEELMRERFKQMGAAAEQAPATQTEAPAPEGAKAPAESVTPSVKTEQTTEATPASEGFNETDYIKKTFGDTFNSPDDIKKTLSERETALTEKENALKERESYIKPATETVSRLNEFLAKGGSVEEFAKTQLTDISKLDPFQLRVMKMKWDFPNLPTEDIEFRLKNQYKIGEEGEYDGKDVRDGKIQLQIDSETDKKALLESQKTDSVPQTERARLATQAQMDKEVEKWLDGVKTSLEGFDKFTVETDKDKTFDFPVSAKTRKEVGELMEDPASILERFTDKKELRNFIFKGLAFDDMVKAAAKGHAAKETETVINGIENPHPQTASKTTGAPETDPIKQARQATLNRLNS